MGNPHRDLTEVVFLRAVVVALMLHARATGRPIPTPPPPRPIDPAQAALAEIDVHHGKRNGVPSRNR